MITSARWRHAAIAVLAVVPALVPFAAAPAQAAVAHPVAAHRALPEPPAADVARTELAELAVDVPHPMTGYSRAKFPHWVKQYGECDTREVVLQRDGQDVVQNDKCQAITGTWVSPYDGRVFTNSKDLDIDHMVSVPVTA